MKPIKTIRMEKVTVLIEYTGNNFCAYSPILLGCVSTAGTLDEMKKNIKEAIAFHVESSLEFNDPIPAIFKEPYELEFKLSIEALLNVYSDIFTKAALSRITGINERQLWHYASGMRKPRPQQRKRIEDGLHRLGVELLNISV
jgi:predicted RNase H-like HicB family nuclease